MQRNILKTGFICIACLAVTNFTSADSTVQLAAPTTREGHEPVLPAQEMVVRVAKIHGYGLFVTRKNVSHSGFSRQTVASDAVTGLRFIDFTTQVPAVLGTNFGFQYSINATPTGQRVPIRSIIRFPEPGLQQPGGKHYRESVEHKFVALGQPDLHGYGFDEDWEIVPGQWVFEIWHKDTRLIRKTFTVVVDEQSKHE